MIRFFVLSCFVFGSCYCLKLPFNNVIGPGAKVHLPFPFIPPMPPISRIPPTPPNPLTSLLEPLPLFPTVPTPRYIRHSLACGNDTLMMSCPPGQQIFVFNANYGRYTADICPSLDPGLNNNLCMSTPDTTKAVTKLCGNRDNCSFAVTDEVFGERCSGTSKYAEVTYKCQTYGRACEGSNLELACPAGTTIAIYDANYGRTLPGSVACPADNSDNLECQSGNAVAISQSLCEGLSTCVIPASTDMFGDPCAGQFKYLEVNYLCI